MWINWFIIHLSWGFGRGKEGKNLWRGAAVTLIWCVWMEKNMTFFENHHLSNQWLWIRVVSIGYLCLFIFRMTFSNGIMLVWKMPCPTYRYSIIFSIFWWIFSPQQKGKEKNCLPLLPSPPNHQNEANIWKNRIRFAWIWQFVLSF